MLNLDVLLSYDVEENTSCDGLMRFLHILVRVGRVEAWMHRAGWYVSAEVWMHGEGCFFERSGGGMDA